jgi:hypothetical protein
VAFDNLLHARFSGVASALVHLALRSGMCGFRRLTNVAPELLRGQTFFMRSGYVNCADFTTVLKGTGLHLSQTIMWAKLPFRPGMLGEKEPLLTARETGWAPVWNG